MANWRTYAAYYGGQILGALLLLGSVGFFLYFSRSSFPKVSPQSWEFYLFVAVFWNFSQHFGKRSVVWLKVDKSEKRSQVFSRFEPLQLRETEMFKDGVNPLVIIIAMIVYAVYVVYFNKFNRIPSSTSDLVWAALLLIAVAMGTGLSISRKGRLLDLGPNDIVITNAGRRFVHRWADLSSIIVLTSRDMFGKEKPVIVVFQNDTGEIVNHVTMASARDNQKLLDNLELVASQSEELTEKDYDQSVAAVRELRKQAFPSPLHSL